MVGLLVPIFFFPKAESQSWLSPPSLEQEEEEEWPFCAEGGAPLQGQLLPLHEEASTAASQLV